MAVFHFKNPALCGQKPKKNPLKTTNNKNEVTCKKCLLLIKTEESISNEEHKPDALDRWMKEHGWK
jgi:hypothetical protein